MKTGSHLSSWLCGYDTDFRDRNSFVTPRAWSVPLDLGLSPALRDLGGAMSNCTAGSRFIGLNPSCESWSTLWTIFRSFLATVWEPLEVSSLNLVRLCKFSNGCVTGLLRISATTQKQQSCWRHSYLAGTGILQETLSCTSLWRSWEGVPRTEWW